MPKLFKLLFRLVVRLVFFLLVTMAVGCLIPQSCSDTQQCNRDITVYFINHGYHTGIAIPVSTPLHNWNNEFDIAPPGSFLEFGWGDRDFYTSGGFPLLIGFKALLLPTPSVVHVVAHQSMDSSGLHSAAVHPIRLCGEQYTALVRYVREAFQRDSVGNTHYLMEGFYGNRSAFYTAVGSYYCFNNCNTWIGGALRAAGQQTPLWDGIPQSLLWHLQGAADTTQVLFEE